MKKQKIKLLVLASFSLFSCFSVSAHSISTTSHQQDFLPNDPFTYSPKANTNQLYPLTSTKKNYTIELQLYKFQNNQEIPVYTKYVTVDERRQEIFSFKTSSLFINHIKEYSTYDFSDLEKHTKSSPFFKNKETYQQKTISQNGTFPTLLSLEIQITPTLTNDVFIHYHTSYTDAVDLRKKCIPHTMHQCLELPTISKFSQEKKWTVPLNQMVNLATFNQTVYNSQNLPHTSEWRLKAIIHENK